jgi:hypothetical protein
VFEGCYYQQVFGAAMGSPFKELGILDIFKINDYLTAMFMFCYHHLKNLPEVFEN